MVTRAVPKVWALDRDDITWIDCNHAKPHPLKRLADAPFAQACGVLNQIVALA